MVSGINEIANCKCAVNSAVKLIGARGFMRNSWSASRAPQILAKRENVMTSSFVTRVNGVVKLRLVLALKLEAREVHIAARGQMYAAVEVRAERLVAMSRYITAATKEP